MSRGIPPAVTELLVGCAVFLAACLSILITHVPGGITLFWPVGASVGVATVTAAMTSESEWMEAADKACYEAKSQGRGRIGVAPG